MIPIQSSYLINEHTLALIPAQAIDYDTIILEQEKRLHIQQTPMQIIETSCLQDWTTYEGRRKSVIYHTNFYQKVPIPININKQIYFFPTHSPKHIDNCWLAYQHILSINQTPQQNDHHQNAYSSVNTIVHFKNGHTLPVHASYHTLQTQMNRTLQVIYQSVY